MLLRIKKIHFRWVETQSWSLGEICGMEILANCWTEYPQRQSNNDRDRHETGRNVSRFRTWHSQREGAACLVNPGLRKWNIVKSQKKK